MEMEMTVATPEDVLLALNRMEETIQVWKAAVVEVQQSGAETMHIAQGPFRGWDPPIPGPEPFTGCWPDDCFISVRPRSGCVEFDIDIYVQQVCGFLLGLYHCLLYDQDHHESSS